MTARFIAQATGDFAHVALASLGVAVIGVAGLWAGYLLGVLMRDLALH